MGNVPPMRVALILLLCAAAVTAPAAGPPARLSPPFAIQRAGAPALPLSRYRGKVVALTFIQTTCPHCQNLTRVLNSIAREYAPRGVQFLECAFNDAAVALLPAFVQQFQPAFPIGWATDESVRAYLGYTAGNNRLLYVPHMVFLDRRGFIRADHPGEGPFFQDPEKNIRAQLDALLKPAPANAGAKK
jgi:thiol-disulfide isomerase/thioredoxin